MTAQANCDTNNNAENAHKLNKVMLAVRPENNGDHVRGVNASSIIDGADQHASDGTICTRQSEWHLLDVDGHSVAASSGSSSSNELEEIHPSELSTLATRPRAKARRRKTDLPQDQVPQVTMAYSTSGQQQAMSDRPYKLAPQHHEDLSPVLVHACAAIYSLMPLASTFAFLTLVCLIFTRFWPITVLYYAYLLIDSKTCNNGGRRIDAVYRSRFWTYLAAHFPVQLRYSKSFALHPSENYILNYHPHGISAFGCVTAFATNGLNFSRLFPGIISRFMVHETSFLVPIMRETFSFRGDCSVNSKSFDYILSKKWQKHQQQGANNVTGNLLALCGGGLAEADLSDSEHLKIVVATRKGFVKKALIHGAHLIPCIAFGENSVFTKVNFKPGSLLNKLESRFYSLFKFKHPIYYGTSVIRGEKGRGILPHRRPITVVMGDPIRVERVEQPSQEQIDQLHGAYMSQLRAIYADHKHLCSSYDLTLELV